MGGMGTIISGLGQAYTQEQAGRTNSKIEDFNAHIAGVQAREAVRQGEAAVSRHRADVAELMGQQRAGYVGQGAVVGKGSAADVVEQSRVLGDRDIQQIRANAMLEAWGFKVQQADARLRSRIVRAEGTQQAIGTLLTTGAKAARYYQKRDQLTFGDRRDDDEEGVY